MRIILTCIGLFFSSVLFAQSKDSLLTLMARETCVEIRSMDFSKIKDEDIELELGMAMMPLLGKYSEELKTVFNIELTDQEAITRLGQDIGIKLITECPEFMKLLASRKYNAEPAVNETLTVKGKLQKVVNGDFTHVIIVDSRGKAEKLWWFGFIDGANLLLDKKNYNENLTVSYSEKEVYNASLGDYVKIKIIAGVKKG